MGKFIDLTGQKFGRLTVIKRVENAKDRHAHWLCKCECGNYKIICGRSLQKGVTLSCGCLISEITTKRSTKHGLHNTRIYSIYNDMKKRCYNKNNKSYENYGGRGIKICDEWLNKKNGFINFYNWAINNNYKVDLTIDRINVNGNYEPSNCKWATIKEQANNRRSNHLITYNGETHNITQWAGILNISYGALKKRIRNGWDIEKAFNTPQKNRT